MFRNSLLLVFVTFFAVYAWKNWFVSLCVAILLAAVVVHPEFPLKIGGIQGANPWNFLILSTLLAWSTQRGEEGDQWDLPHVAAMMLLGCLLVVSIGVVRLLLNDSPSGYPYSFIVSEFFVNSVKWTIPSLLLFDACRTRRRVTIALGVILGLYFLLAVQVLRWMPLSSIGGGEDLAVRASRVIQREVGFNRVTLSMMLAGASWAALAAIPMLTKNLHRLILLGVAGTIALGQALTGGRTGYITWIAIGVILAALRWRKLLLVLPVALLTVGFVLPGVRERMLQGFGGREGNFSVGISAYEMTSGRDVAWPVVFEQIRKAPLLGHGRQGMVTTGARDSLMNDYGESFGHPHQAYLEQWLDNGVFGMLLVVSFFLYMLRHGIAYILERNDPLVCAVGCLAFCLVLALMIGSFGGQTFYPREGSVGMWASIGLLLRVHVNSLNAWNTGDPVFPDDLPEKWFVRPVVDQDEEWIDGEADPVQL